MAGPIDPRLLRRARATRTYLAAGIAVGSLTAVLTLSQAWLISHSVADIFATGQLASLGWAVGGLVAVFGTKALLSGTNEWLANRTAAAVKSQLRRDLLTARLTRPVDTRTSTAGLISLVTQGLDALDGYFSKYLPQLVLAVIVPLVVWVAVLGVDLTSAVILALTLPLIPVFMALVGWTTEALTRRRWAMQTRLATHFADLVAGLPTLQVFGRAKAQAEGLRRSEAAHRGETMRTLRVSFLSALVLELLSTLSVAVIAVTVGFRVLYGDLDLATALFVLILAPEAYLPVRQVGVHYHDAADGIAAAEAAFDLIDGAESDDRSRLARSSRPQGSLSTMAEVRPRNEGGVSKPPAVNTVLNVRQVSHTYPGTDAAALAPTSFDVGAGEIVALSGPSGCGKTTLLNIVMGFIAPSQGSIEAAGRVAWVGQQPGLVAGTVADNVRLGHPGATDVAVREALELAGAGEIPPDQVVGDEAEGVSAGERRRIAVARALLRVTLGRARLLVLDEPTAGLDADTEAGLLATLRSLGVAILVVSHRQAVLAQADRVVTLATPSMVAAETPDQVRGDMGQHASPADATPTPTAYTPNQVPGDKGQHASPAIPTPTPTAYTPNQVPGDKGQHGSPAIPTPVVTAETPDQVRGDMGQHGSPAIPTPTPTADTPNRVPGDKGQHASPADAGISHPTAPAETPDQVRGDVVGEDGRRAESLASHSTATTDTPDPAWAEAAPTEVGPGRTTVIPAKAGISRLAVATATPEQARSDDQPPAQALGGMAAGLARAEADRANDDSRPLLRRILAAVPGSRGRLTLAGFLGFLATGSAVALMAVSAWLLSRAAELPPVLYLYAPATAVRALGIGRGVFRYAERLAGHDVALRLQSALRLETYTRLARTTLLGRRRGDLLARVIADVESIQDLVVRVWLPFASSAVVLLLTAAVLGVLSPGAALVLLATSALAGLVIPALAGRASATSDSAVAPLRGELASAVHSIARTAPDLVAYHASEAWLERFAAIDARLRRSADRSAAVRGVATCCQVLAAGTAVVAALVIGGRQVADGTLPPVMLAVLVLTPLALHEALAGLTQAAQTRTRARTALHRVEAVVTAEPVGSGDRVDTGQRVDRPALQLDNLAAGWPGQAAVVKGLSLTLAAGDKVALVGPSGIGKTTVAATVLGLIPPLAGHVKAHGRVGYLAQDAHIFTTSVAENVLIGNRDAGPEQTADALARAGLDLSPERLVGEAGATLSGGEARRLALARILVGDYQVLVLDEPTEHLDAATATALVDDLWTTSADRPVLVITHDPALVARCDRAVELVSPSDAKL